MKRALFIDRDGTLIVEPPVTEQVNNLEELEFIPGVIRNLYFLRQNTDFELVIVSNQDGLGTSAYPQENFDKVQSKMLQVFKNEGIEFDNILIDKSRKEDNLPTRKPGTGMLKDYMTGDYDLSASFVIGDRSTDAQLAANLGCKAIILGSEQYPTWDKITEVIFAGERTATISRKTKETDINISLNLDGCGKTNISTGLGFFDHMLEQIGKHSGIDLLINIKGDLNVDEHHTMEDTAIALGEALYKALGEKRGIERYGFCLPMDDCLCSVAMDLGGRPWLVWNVKFSRDMIGDTPTEMFLHFFKSLSDNAKMNLNIKAEGENEHHKIEGVFKAFAKALKCAIRRDIYNYELPSTKGSL
ncbi:MAG: bifunctional histidinol-phosphatase/imidazoleglycerol-phosphate dehydratase HisB [Paludibacteraceae bacterium]|nr:bifunctional histidinol-phosphatase/imidazoleglycerol-phosphate dehydratase HisB [Paludibacteraceae bacterium]